MRRGVFLTFFFILVCGLMVQLMTIVGNAEKRDQPSQWAVLTLRGGKTSDPSPSRPPTPTAAASQSSTPPASASMPPPSLTPAVSPTSAASTSASASVSQTAVAASASATPAPLVDAYAPPKTLGELTAEARALAELMAEASPEASPTPAPKIEGVHYGFLNSTDTRCWVPVFSPEPPVIGGRTGKKPAGKPNMEFEAGRDKGEAETAPRCAPYWFVIGEFKCGTTSLYKYLSYHPEVKLLDAGQAPNAVRVKEPGVLGRSLGMTAATYSKYLQSFPIVKPGDMKVTGEATPNNLFSVAAPQAMKQTVPHGKFIALLRDPVERAYSHVNHFMKLHGQPVEDSLVSGTFDLLVEQDMPGVVDCISKSAADWTYQQWSDCWSKALRHSPVRVPRNITAMRDRKARRAAPQNLANTPEGNVGRFRSLYVIPRGMYIFQLMNWAKEFNGDQLLVVRSEDMYNNTVETMQKIADFIGLSPFDWSVVHGKKFNVAKITDLKDQPKGSKVGIGLRYEKALGMREHALSEKTRRLLRKFFRPYNRMLDELVGRTMWQYPDDEGA